MTVMLRQPDGSIRAASPQDLIDGLIQEAAVHHKRLWETLLTARLEACTQAGLPLVAKLNGWISDMSRMWQGCGPEETSGDSGLKHLANAVRMRRAEHERCPEVKTDAF